MTTIMEEFLELLIIGAFGVIVSVLNLMNEFADTLVGCIVGLATFVFLIFKVVAIHKEIQLKNIELREKRTAKETYKKTSDDKRKKSKS